MKKNKIAIITAIIILCALLGSIICALICTNKIKSDRDNSLYMEFLNGNLAADGLAITDITTPTGEPEKRYFTEYTFFDSDGDGLEELHVRSDRYYYVIDCESATLHIWKTMYPTTKVLNNGDYLYTHIGGAPLHYDYEYFAVNQEGEDIFSVSFSWYDDNLNGEVDEEDVFLKEGTEISYEEWEEIEEKYLEVGSDEISWGVLETVTELTKEEALDAVFAHFYGTTEGMVDFTSYETEDGRIGYTWYTEHNLYDPVLLEQEGTSVNSKGETYQFFILCCKLCGTEGIHYRTEIFQEFAVNMCTGQIIEVREYDYMGFWEYSRDYRTYILEEKKTEGNLTKRTAEFFLDKNRLMKGDYRFEEYKFDYLSTYTYSDCLSRYAADYVYPDILNTPDAYSAYLDMWKAEYEEAMKILGAEADESLARKLRDYNARFEELQLAVTDFIENANPENQKYAELYLALMVRDATLDLYSLWYVSTGEIAFDMVEECTEVVIPSMYFDASLGEDNALDRDFARFEFDGTTLKGEEMLYKMYSGWLEEVEDLGEAASPETGYADYIFRCQTALEYYFEAREELGYEVWFVDEFTQFGYSTYKFMAVRDYALMLEDIYNRAVEEK